MKLASLFLVAAAALTLTACSAPGADPTPAPTVTVVGEPAPAVTVTVTPPPPTEWTQESLWQACKDKVAEPRFAWYGPGRAEVTEQPEGWLVTIYGTADEGNFITTALMDCTVSGTPAESTVEFADIRH